MISYYCHNQNTVSATNSGSGDCNSFRICLLPLIPLVSSQLKSQTIPQQHKLESLSSLCSRARNVFPIHSKQELTLSCWATGLHSLLPLPSLFLFSFLFIHSHYSHPTHKTEHWLLPLSVFPALQTGPWLLLPLQHLLHNLEGRLPSGVILAPLFKQLPPSLEPSVPLFSAFLCACLLPDTVHSILFIVLVPSGSPGA